MKQHLLPIAVVVLSSLAFACGGATRPVASPTMTAGIPETSLEGRSFDVTLDAPDGATKDTLRFAQGKFESTTCTPMGFAQWTDYATNMEAGATKFRVVTRHPQGTQIAWEGTVRGEAIEGTATRTMNGKTEAAKFSGKAK
jgi:hypothetical protein